MSLELVNVEVDNFDFSSEDDRVYGDLTYAASANPQPQSSRLIFTSEKWFEKEQLVRYVEEFDPESLARATWGEGMPVFESLHLKQEQASSWWDPFKDEEEWELAEWLVDNLGQNQTNIFLKLPIVFFF